MQLHEWSLIIFSIIMQMAVGTFVILGGVHFFAVRRYSEDKADCLSDRALLAIGPAVVLALIVTFFHLGNPMNAPRAIMNIGASWLSREIALAILFSVGGAVFAFMQWRKISTAEIRQGVALVVALIGLVLVYAMSQIYSVPTVPAWDSLATVATFYLTTFLLGGLAVGTAYAANYWWMTRGNKLVDAGAQSDILVTTLRWIALLSIALLGVQFVVIPLYLGDLAMQASAAATESVAIIMGQNGVLLATRLLLLFVGAGIFSAFVYVNTSSESKLRVVSYLVYAAFGVVLISEILGRFLFYASKVTVGL